MIAERIVGMIADYLKDEPNGGPLHIVIGDINMGRDFVEYCRVEAVKCGDDDAMDICDALLTLSEVDIWDTVDPTGDYHIMGSTTEIGSEAWRA